VIPVAVSPFSAALVEILLLAVSLLAPRLDAAQRSETLHTAFGCAPNRLASRCAARLTGSQGRGIVSFAQIWLSLR
jgi:hypothetical protein